MHSLMYDIIYIHLVNYIPMLLVHFVNDNTHKIVNILYSINFQTNTYFIVINFYIFPTNNK